MTFLEQLGSLHVQWTDKLIPNGEDLSVYQLRRARLLVGMPCYAQGFGSLLLMVRYMTKGWTPATQAAIAGLILLGFLLLFYNRFSDSD